MITPTPLRGRWLPLARIAWVILAVLYIGAFLFSIPLKLTEIPDFTTMTEGVTQSEFIAGLAQMGISSNGYITFRQWSSVFIPLIYFALAIFIFWRKSDDGMALLTSFLFLSFLSGNDALARLNPIWQTVGEVSNILSSVTLFLWFFTFPDGRFVPRSMRWIFLGLLLTQVWRMFQLDVYQKSFPWLVPIIFGGILITQVYRYRRAGAAQRQQIKWVVFGIVAGTVPLLLFFVVYAALLNSQSPLTRVIALNFFGEFLWEFFIIVLPVSLTFAIFRSRLFDIDIIIRKTVTYALVGALLATVYFGIIILFQQLFASVTGQRNEIITVASTLAIAALFVPLRNKIQEIIDRRFYRKKYDAQQVLSDFANMVRDETDLEKLTGRLIEVVNETMQPKGVSVWLTTGKKESGKQPS